MCTALTYHSNNCFYFGRNLDLDMEYGERVTVIPRNFSFPMKCLPDLKRHYALIGMAVIADGCPLFFEATNEKGLSAAGLNFPGNALYGKPAEEKINLAPYELIPFILGKYACLEELMKDASKINIIDVPFSENLTNTPLHWIISDKNGSVTVESTKSGLHFFDNPYGTLANNPPFPEQARNAENADSLPGDFSSEARFIRGSYLVRKASPKKGEEESVAQFFRMLNIVSVPEGCVTKEGKAHFTRYSCCCNTDTGVYYYNRNNSYEIKKTDMTSFNLSSDRLFTT